MSEESEERKTYEESILGVLKRIAERIEDLCAILEDQIEVDLREIYENLERMCDEWPGKDKE